ncbi:MAG TPA: hypothetical protein VGK24_17440 [Candidatus Angelobacter sp.]|jgi:hypothetical protein
MFLPAHKIVRGMVLGLMFFLAGTAYCSCDSYDPDPYDDIPPVVTVEYNYVVPACISIQLPQSQNRNKFVPYAGTKVEPLAASALSANRESQIADFISHAPPQWHIPLRL